jgi:hypothetical protein
MLVRAPASVHVPIRGFASMKKKIGGSKKSNEAKKSREAKKVVGTTLLITLRVARV